MLVYIGCIALLGLPVMLAEMIIGRESKKNVVGAYRHFTSRRGWSWFGYGNVIIPFLIMGFYFVVSGWTAEYFFASVTGQLSQLSSVEEYKALFNNFVASAYKPIIFTWIFVAVNHFIIVSGVNKGIERASKLLMPLLFVILVALSIKSLTMPNSIEGLAFLFKPDFSKITPDIFYKAMGQAFFSLSVGLGALITYASYFDNKTKLIRTAVSVTVLDTLVAVIAAVMIFPVVFSVGIEPTAGPSLVFVTLPAVLNTMPLSILWSSIFFILLIIAALTSTLSLHEVITLFVIEECKIPRRWATTITSLCVGVLATVASLSLGAAPQIAVAGRSLFDALDFLTSNIMLPLSGMGISLFAGWVVSREARKRQLTDYGKTKFNYLKFFEILLKYICPALLIIVFLDSLGLI